MWGWIGNNLWMLVEGIGLILIAVGFVIVRRTKYLGKAKSPHPYALRMPHKNVQERTARVLSQAIAIETTQSQPKESFDRLWQYLKEQYPKMHRTLELKTVGHSLLYCFRGTGEAEPIMLCAHMDSVVADADGWTYPPFSGKQKNECIWGRGALDGKSTLIALYDAVETLLEEGHTPTRDIYLGITRDEEQEGHIGAAHLARHLKDAGVRLDFVLGEGEYIIQDFLGQNRNPCATVHVAEKGMMNMMLVARATGGHAAYPPKHTALGRLCEAVARIENTPMKRELTPLATEYFETIARVMPYKFRLMIANRWLFNRILLHRLSKTAQFRALITHTIAATMAGASAGVTILPKRAYCTLNIRPLPGTSDAELHNHILKIVEPLGISTHVLHQEEPSQLDARGSEIYQTLKHVIKKQFGAQVIVAPGLSARTSDSKHYETICSNVMRFTPIMVSEKIKETVHGIDERIPISAVGAASEFYRALIKEITSKEKIT